MNRLAFVDHRQDPASWARALGISREAVDLYLGSDVIDLHIDTFIWNRVFGYDLTKRHGRGPFGARFFGQADLPRLREARVTGGIWAITTNPLRRSAGRARAFRSNIARLSGIFESVPADVRLVRTAGEYRAAVDAGLHAAFLGIQGGNALDQDGALSVLDEHVGPGGLSNVLRVTLVHLSTSSLGATSAPMRGKEDRLTEAGRRYVAELDRRRIFVDLAHIARGGFFDVVEAHDRTRPLIVTHTGVAGIHRHWRNLDDAQLRAVADSGGTVGIMYQSSFLGDAFLGGRAEAVAEHLCHIVTTVGDDHASLGSDWDGAILPPRDMPTCLELPRLVELLLRRGLSPETVRKILGQSFLRALTLLRG